MAAAHIRGLGRNNLWWRPVRRQTTTAICSDVRIPQDTVAEQASLYTVNTANVHACAELYADWKWNRPGWKHVDPRGVRVPIPYIQTRGAGGPSVVAIHGAPGTFRDFDSLVPVLDAQGASVVVPTLPDLIFSMKTQGFWHSVEEKTDLLKKFLQSINVREIDVMIVHSSNMYPTLWLATTDPDIRIKSLVFIAPSGCRRIDQLSPYWLMKAFDKWFRVPQLQPLMCGLAVHVVSVLGKPNNNQIKETILSMISIMHAKYDQSEPLLRDLVRRNVPMLMLYGEKDKLINYDVSVDMAALLGVLPHQMRVYGGKNDAQAVLIQEGEPQGNSEVVCFREGTHFAFKKYPNIFNDLILRFWEKHHSRTI